MQTTCAFISCDRPIKTMSLCHAHYMQTHRGEELRPLRRLAKGGVAERMDAYTNRTDGCWLWTGSKVQGYGQLRSGIETLRAHRVAYELAVGPIPEGAFIDHMCRVRACVRPDHLQLVTNKTNMENRGGPNLNSTSGIQGVSWDPITSKWRARVMHEGRAFNVGRFADIEAANAAVVAKRNQLFTNNLADR